MKKLCMVLCVVIMFFGIVGCPGGGEDDQGGISTFNSTTSTPVATSDVNGGAPLPAPEPATLILLGTGMVGLAVYGRKKFKK